MGRYSKPTEDASDWEDPEPEDQLDDWEDPDESDQDSNDDPELVPCPYCKKLISEDTEICHLCGSYISREDSDAPAPLWVIVGAVACIIVVVIGLLTVCRWAYGW